MIVRALRETDHGPIIAVVNEWWYGRNVASKLPRLFFDHFQDTSFVVEEDEEIVAFLVGFVSQSPARAAYVHFAGVDPGCRNEGLGRRLYETFFEKVRRRGCERVRCMTSPANRGSIAFHASMGFEIEEGDGGVDDVSVHTNYDGDGIDKVVFEDPILIGR
ncbi:MAG TPA: GNAT family N-acetyltransferase [Rubrobacteraceae bacterium]|nr:GNAT family N-acetyltransferase [Rubrobacteraceae bacterium]